MTTVKIDTKKLIGMDELRAVKLVSALGGEPNITKIDGFQKIINTDFKMSRVNLEIVNGKVIRACIG